jgi:integrase
MPRPTTGAVIEHAGKDGKVYRTLRFSVGGKRYRTPLGPVSAAAAEKELRCVLVEVEQGTWVPPVAVVPPPEPTTMPTFHEFSADWWLRVEGQLAPRTKEDYQWRLSVHLLNWFGELPLNQISSKHVKDYIAGKIAEGEEIRKAAAAGNPVMEEITDKRGRTYVRPAQPLGARAINMTLVLLAAILEEAVEDELIEHNPAKGKKRRVKEKRSNRTYLESADQITALLDAAGELDREASTRHKHIERRASLAVLVFAGLRISELTALRWRHVDLAGGWLAVEESKTDAGVRKVKIRGALRDELLAARHRAQNAPQDAFVYPTATGGQQDTHNARARVVAAAVKRASEKLEADGQAPLPIKLTPHALRRTFCSLLYALGEDPGVVMDEMGHTDEGLALRVYRQAMRRGEAEKAQLQALVEGGVLANSGQRAPIAADAPADAEAA